MTFLQDLVGDTALALGLLASLILASCWGELGGIAPGSDLSSLRGFVMVFVFLPVRWLLGLLALTLATAHGTMPGLPAPDATAWSLVLGGHALLGAASLVCLDLALQRVHRNHFVPRALCMFGGVLLPMPMFVLASVGCNADWLGESPPTLAAFTLLSLAAHLWAFRAGRAAMQQRSIPPA